MPEPENNDSTINPAAQEPTTGAGAGAPVAEKSDPETQLTAAKAEAAQNYEKFMRVAADLENFRRRSVREKEDLRLYAATKVLEDLLPPIDNLGLALSAARQPGAEIKALVGGVELVLAQLKSALANHGLVEINPAGSAFDANLHEALSAQPSAEIPEGKVLTVVRNGFSLNGRLLRPASVIVSSGSGKPGPDKSAR
jgi:molecular chaperone GrpE